MIGRMYKYIHGTTTCKGHPISYYNIDEIGTCKVFEQVMDYHFHHLQFSLFSRICLMQSKWPLPRRTCGKMGHCPQEDLAKSGYKQHIKHKKLFDLTQETQGWLDLE